MLAIPTDFSPFRRVSQCRCLIWTRKSLISKQRYCYFVQYVGRMVWRVGIANRDARCNLICPRDDSQLSVGVPRRPNCSHHSRQIRPPFVYTTIQNIASIVWHLLDVCIICISVARLGNNRFRYRYTIRTALKGHP